MMKKHLVFAVVPFLALGCGEDLKDENGDGIADGVREPDSVTVVTPANPKGTVSGQVLGTNLSALGDVSVEMTIGSSDEPVAATTDAKGNFEFKDVPAGAQVLLTFSKGGYATLRASSTVPSSAGNVPINNGNASFGPITLAKLDGTMNFLVVRPDGRPAAAVKATLEATPAGSIVLFNNDNTTQVVSTVVVEAESDAQGLLTFRGIPSATELARLDNGNGRYKLYVSPMDVDTNGIPETGGFFREYYGSEVVANSTTRLIPLPFTRPSGAALNVESSNVGSLRGATDTDPLGNMVRPGDPIHLFFNQPVQPNSMLARLTDESGRESLSLNVAVSNHGYSATLTPSAPLVDGREYNVDLRAVSAEGGSLFTRTGFFFAGDPASARAVTIQEIRYQETSTSSTQINPGERIYITFSSPIARTYGASAYVQVFFDANIADASATSINDISDVPGELGNPVGFDLFIDEPFAPLPTRTPAETAPFAITASNYSSRYSFIYNGSFPLSPNNLRIHVSFDKLASRSSGSTNGVYESVWGQPITSNLTASSVATQPVPAQ
ncbi:carboxypeptidase-like regulatory domain-containing protein [Pyxidicoccus xibeiensis]|uniref:carboxypeptidase-like regulatory domain-containing protein n=1 Tax=Pyxidicoccus xibeiensis TaxID=2906759 RepID=UPI0020A6E437|nr:carboxypeptidase-like regulatory domain-containing protein [Pyxidicoccus xibeiensis]MCP3136372.1 carboxypeptidase-like regulatory domain-containing protein [Pyxidicoccus xibeiensis]